jgi:hypothetical protein
MMKSDQARTYIETLKTYEDKEKKREENLRKGKFKSARLPYAASADHRHREMLMRKVKTDEE